MSAVRKARVPVLASWLLLCFSSAIFSSYWHAACAESLLAVRGHSDSPVIAIPFDYVRGHIFLQVALDGIGTRTIMLDTGFTSNMKMLMVDSPIAAQLRMSKGEPLEIDSMGTDNVHGRRIGDVDLHLTDDLMVHTAAETFSLSLLRVALNHPLDGIMGFAFLRDYVAEIDYSNHVLRLYNPTHYRYHGNGLEIPMDKARPVIHAQVMMPDGRTRQTQLLIDTGSDAVLLFYRHFIDRYSRMLRSANLQQTSYVGLAGRYTCDVVQLSKVQLGSNMLGRQMWVNSPYAELAPMANGISAKSHLDGDLGNPLLQGMTVIFDPARKRLILELVPLKLASN